MDMALDYSKLKFLCFPSISFVSFTCVIQTRCCCYSGTGLSVSLQLDEYRRSF